MRRERGVALLEVLAAVIILGVAGLALVDLVAGGTRAVSVARDRERELADEERLLTAWSLLKRDELDQRIGERPVGPYVMRVQRPERGLYRLAVERSAASGVEDLVTVVWRGGPADVR
ncbi:MAG TPA: type II secretion system protein [Gemmatimonadales bacterium]|jgi:type II secretory pathway component PulJ|nr:type II secretion system protein [Gemmatimonadales bacterium]